MSDNVTAFLTLLSTISHQPQALFPNAISLAPSASSLRLVSSPCVWQTLKLVWLKRSIAADLYVFSASNTKVPRKQRSTNCPECRNPSSHPRFSLPHSTPLPAQCPQPRRNTAHWVFLHCLPCHSSKAWHTYPFESPSGSHQCMSPRRLRVT